MSLYLPKDLLDQIFKMSSRKTKIKMKLTCKYLNNSYNIMIYDQVSNQLTNPCIMLIIFDKVNRKQFLMKNNTPTTKELHKFYTKIFDVYKSDAILKHMDTELHFNGTILKHEVYKINKLVWFENDRRNSYYQHKHRYFRFISDTVTLGRYYGKNAIHAAYNAFLPFIIKHSIMENTLKFKMQETTRGSYFKIHNFIGKYEINNTNSNNRKHYNYGDQLKKTYDVTIYRLIKKYVFTIDNNFDRNIFTDKNMLTYNINI